MFKIIYIVESTPIRRGIYKRNYQSAKNYQLCQITCINKHCLAYTTERFTAGTDSREHKFSNVYFLHIIKRSVFCLVWFSG